MWWNSAFNQEQVMYSYQLSVKSKTEKNAHKAFLDSKRSKFISKKHNLNKSNRHA